MGEVGGTFSKSAHPNDDAKHGEAGEPTAHDGVYKVDGHRWPEPHAGEKNFRFLSQATGPESPLPPDFFSPWAGHGASLSAKKFAAFFAVMGRGRQPNQRFFRF